MYFEAIQSNLDFDRGPCWACIWVKFISQDRKQKLAKNILPIIFGGQTIVKRSNFFMIVRGVKKSFLLWWCQIADVRRSPPRRSPPQTFTTSEVHHLRRSPPQTFTTSDIHHPQCKIRRSPPQTFTTPDVHHLRRSPPQTFTTPFVKSDVHHPRHSPPQTFTTPYSKMLHSPPTNIHHQPTSPSPTMITPKRKIRQPCTRAVECSCYLQVIELFLIIFV